MNTIPEAAAKLRAPFPPELIGKLPRAATKAAAERGERGHCDECGKYHVLPAIHLDYVGHAAVTDRLLAVDPAWTWEPMGYDDHGRPALVSGIGEPGESIGLWIKLTVCGVTRPGFGGGKSAKEAISDAIRNAAMRFGVALDLWSKEDLHSNGATPAAEEMPTETQGQGVEGAGSASAESAPAPEKATSAQVKKCHTVLGIAYRVAGLLPAEYIERLRAKYGTSHFSELTKAQASEVIGELEAMERDAAIPF